MDHETPPSTPRSVVEAALRAHGVAVPSADLDALAEAYPVVRRRMDRLHTVDCGDR
jgi:hypothetical protein